MSTCMERNFKNIKNILKKAIPGLEGESLYSMAHDREVKTWRASCWARPPGLQPHAFLSLTEIEIHGIYFHSASKAMRLCFSIPTPFFWLSGGHTTEFLWVVAGNVLHRLAKPSFWWAEGPGGQEGLQRILLVNTRHMLSTGLSLALKKNSFCFEILSHVDQVGLKLADRAPIPDPKYQVAC